MALQTSGVITAGDINVELGKARNALFVISSTDARNLSGVLSGTIKMSDFYGKSTLPAILDLYYTTPGAYDWVVPNGVYSVSVYVQGAGGGGGGGGGAGEMQWTASAGGGGGGGGGAGQTQTGIYAVIPGQVIRINVGGGGGGGRNGNVAWSGGSSSRANGLTGWNGANGGNSTFGALVAQGGGGGYGGGGGAGDAPLSRAAGGSSGYGWPSGNASSWNQGSQAGNWTAWVDNWDNGGNWNAGQSYYNYYGDSEGNVIGGDAGGAITGDGRYGITNLGGSGGYGGTWGYPGWEQYSGTYAGGYGSGGSNGLIYIRMASTIALPSPTVGYSGNRGSVNYPLSGVIFRTLYYQNQGGSCFPAGSNVLMGDSSWKAIELLILGDMVMSVDGPTEIIDMFKPILGSRRMLQFSKDSIFNWSEEHAIWSKRDTKQWWWSANPDMWRDEVRRDIIPGLKDNSSMRGDIENIEWAHLDGWKTDSIIEIPASPETILYLPVTKGKPIIVDGYLVGAGINESLYDYNLIDWNVSRMTINNNLSLKEIK